MGEEDNILILKGCNFEIREDGMFDPSDRNSFVQLGNADGIDTTPDGADVVEEAEEAAKLDENDGDEESAGKNPGSTYGKSFTRKYRV